MICAQEARFQLALERIALVPVGEAPHRELEDDPGTQVRVELCERAAGAEEWLTASRIEVDREGPSYTVDTLRLLRERSPDDELTVILGADQAAALPSWREPEEVLRLARVAVASREGIEREAVLRRIEGLAGAERIAFFDMPRIDVSSTLVRERAASGRPIRYLVPDEVADLIHAKGLYRGASPPPAAAE